MDLILIVSVAYVKGSVTMIDTVSYDLSHNLNHSDTLFACKSNDP